MLQAVRPWVIIVWVVGFVVPHRDGGSLGHVHHSAGCHTLVVAAAIDIANLATPQVNNGRELVGVKAIIKRINLSIIPVITTVETRSQSIVTAGTEDLGGVECSCAVGNIDEHIAAVLRFVALTIARIARTGTEDVVQLVLAMFIGTDVHIGTLLCRYMSALTPECGVVVVIATVAAAEDGVDAALQVFHIGDAFQHLGHFVLLVAMNHGLVIGPVSDTLGEVIAILELSEDGAAEIVAAVDVVTHPGEARLVAAVVFIRLATDVHLGMSQNVGIAGTAEGIIDAAVTQIDVGVATDVAHVAAAVNVFTLSQFYISIVAGIDGRRAVQVDGGTISYVKLILLLISVI